MNRLFSILIVLLCFSSCSTIEDNSAALQGVNGSVLFKATTSQATFNPNGSLVIRGDSGAGETVNFLISSQGPQVVLGGAAGDQNIAVYIDQAGNQFSTAFEDATGIVNYTLNGTESVSGDFKFTAFTPGKTDTVVFSKGFIFKVPFVSAIPMDLPDAVVDDQFTARVNTANFNPTIFANTVSEGVLTLSGQTSSRSIAVVLPVDTLPGAYDMLGGTDIYGTYTNQMGVNESTSGLLQVISNDADTRVITGEFSFETAAGFSITDGAFVINY